MTQYSLTGRIKLENSFFGLRIIVWVQEEKPMECSCTLKVVRWRKAVPEDRSALIGLNRTIDVS